MTHPITPREKVERAIKDAICDDAGVGLQMTLTPRFMRGLVDRVLDATAVVDNEANLVSGKPAALASGSGVHAELEVWSLSAHWNPPVVTLSSAQAVIAALRADGEIYQNQADHEFLLRKEAERKLAEAVEVIEFYAKTHTWRSSTVYACGHSGRTRAESDGGNLARTFLSKEAERG